MQQRETASSNHYCLTLAKETRNVAAEKQKVKLNLPKYFRRTSPQ